MVNIETRAGFTTAPDRTNTQLVAVDSISDKKASLHLHHLMIMRIHKYPVCHSKKTICALRCFPKSLVVGDRVRLACWSHHLSSMAIHFDIATTTVRGGSQLSDRVLV